MFSTSLIFTTLVATLCAVSRVNAADLDAKNPVNTVQCQDTTLEWTGGVPPYNVYVFTDCKDDNAAPIASFTNIAGNSVKWGPTLYSGDGFFFQVEDSTGADAFSDDAYLGGDANKVEQCQQEVAAQQASESSSTNSATSSPASATTPASDDAVAANNVPTTMSRPSSTSVGASGVANAASGPSGGVNQGASSDKLANGASSLVARPVELALGVLAAGVVAFL